MPPCTWRDMLDTRLGPSKALTPGTRADRIAQRVADADSGDPARRVYCDRCIASLTRTDLLAGYCTQCGEKT
jgi:hypothetical protein